MDSASSKAVVLCFSHDSSLLMTRQWMLERSNYTVIAVMSQQEFREQLCRTPIHLILLCQTLSAAECAAAVSFAQEHAPATRCAVLLADHAKPVQCEAVEVDVSRGPAQFMDTIFRMTPASVQATTRRMAG